MKKNIFGLIFGLFIFPFLANLQAQDFGLYISPGIKIGYQTSIGVSFTIKMSIGAYIETDEAIGFISVAAAQRVSGGNEKFQNISFLKFQAGHPLVNAGIGFGKAKTQNGKYPVTIASFSMGWLAYFEVDNITRSDGQTFQDVGIMGVMPIPFGGYDIGLQ